MSSTRVTRTEHEKYLRVALLEAKKGIGCTSPNPAVGAVIVKKGQILSRGWHRRAGALHAEIEALNALPSRSDARGATLYITLEPCSTHGRTPPCTEAIIQAGFRHVVWGATDPNPAHAGRAEKILRAAGIRITTGVLANECTALNTAWNHWITTGTPYVTVKFAMSLDGRIRTPPGTSRLISSAASRRDAMLLRREMDAILVGADTVRVDNPSLTLRGPAARGRQQPWRIVLTRSGQLPAKAKVFTDPHRDRTCVFRSISIPSLLKKLGAMDITSLLVEGGGHVLGAFLDAGAAHRVVAYLCPVVFGGPTPAIAGKGVWDNIQGMRLQNPMFQRIGDDLKIDTTLAR